MVRVPGSLGDVGYHRDSLDDAQGSNGSGDEAPTEIGSPTASLNARSTDQQNPGRSFADGTEDDLLEEKPHPPPQVPKGTPADLDASRYLPDEEPKAQAGRSSSTKTHTASGASSKKKKTKAARKKLKAPESDGEDVNTGTLKSSWSRTKLEMAYLRTNLTDFLHRDPVMRILQPKLLGSITGPVHPPKLTANKLEAATDLLRMMEEAGLTAGAFDADELFQLSRDKIMLSAASLYNQLHSLTGELPASKMAEIGTVSKPITTTDEKATPSKAKTPEPQATHVRSPESHTGSSLYASATSEAGSSNSSEPQRMSLGPSGAAMLQLRSVQELNPSPRDSLLEETRVIPTAPTQDSTSSLESYFQAAMSRFLRERGAPKPPTRSVPNQGTQDVEMESVGSVGLHAEHWEYDPDDLHLSSMRRTAATSAAAFAPTPIGATAVQRVKISAISDLKEFTGKDHDEVRARGWISKVKSAFMRDQATEEEKCLTFADLLTGPARNWYRELSPDTRTKWKHLLHSFQTQYCGLGVSVAWQYYHARRRSDETPLEYLYRLNVAGLRAKLKVKDGNAKSCREHVEHFIETLGDQELAHQLTMLRLPDADELEDTLRALDRAKTRQKKPSVSGKYRPKPTTAQPSAPARAVRAIHVPDSDSEPGSESDGSDFDGELRRAYVAAATEQSPAPAANSSREPDLGHQAPAQGAGQPQEGRQRFGRDGQQRCTHCGSRKHSDLGCWKRLICQKCGKKGHPSDRCFFVCRGCGELHDHGKCQMEEFDNLIRQWYNPSSHPGLLPAAAEKMLN